jgi:hypothetical protein
MKKIGTTIAENESQDGMIRRLFGEGYGEPGLAGSAKIFWNPKDQLSSKTLDGQLREA